jgi:membrane protease YdiL (CAAX protease family)
MKKQPVLWYFILAFAFTYSVSFLAVSKFIPVGLESLFIFGPTVAALIVSAALGGWAEIKQLLKSILIWRVGILWYLFVFLFPVLARLLAVGVDLLLGGKVPQFLSSKTVNYPGVSPLLLLIVLFAINFFIPSLVEEIGWRGFAFPRLQNRFGALGAGLILGLLWGLWHLHPLNTPNYQHVIVWFVLSTIAASVIFAWLYNHTGGSVLITALFHASNNVSEFVVPVAPLNTGEGITTAYIALRIIYLLFAAVIGVLFWKNHSA